MNDAATPTVYEMVEAAHAAIIELLTAQEALIAEQAKEIERLKGLLDWRKPS